MKGQKNSRDLNGHGHGNRIRRKPLNSILKIVITIAGMGVAAGVIYGVISIFSLYSIATGVSNQPKIDSKTYKITQNQLPKEEAAPQKEVTASVKPAAPPSDQAEVEPVVPDPAMDNEMEETATVAAEYEEDAPPEIMALKTALQDLSEALPDNMMLPAERSEAQIEDLMSDMQEQQALQELIDQDSATAEQRQRYYDLVSKPLEDEKELIHYCSDVIANSSDTDSPANALCFEATRQADERLSEIEDQLEKLRQKL